MGNSQQTLLSPCELEVRRKVRDAMPRISATLRHFYGLQSMGPTNTRPGASGLVDDKRKLLAQQLQDHLHHIQKVSSTLRRKFVDGATTESQSAANVINLLDSDEHANDNVGVARLVPVSKGEAAANELAIRAFDTVIQQLQHAIKENG